MGRDLYEIAELEGPQILGGRYSSKVIARKYDLSIKDAVYVRELSKVHRSVVANEALRSAEDFNPKWFVLEQVFGSRIYGQACNRAWKTLYDRYGKKFGFSYEELVAWGKWVVAERACWDDGVEAKELDEEDYECAV